MQYVAALPRFWLYFSKRRKACSAHSKTPWATALAVCGTHITAVGTDADLSKHRAHAHVIDLHGQSVIPGIVDSHAHVSP